MCTILQLIDVRKPVNSTILTCFNVAIIKGVNIFIYLVDDSYIFKFFNQPIKIKIKIIEQKKDLLLSFLKKTLSSFENESSTVVNNIIQIIQ